MELRTPLVGVMLALALLCAAQPVAAQTTVDVSLMLVDPQQVAGMDVLRVEWVPATPGANVFFYEVAVSPPPQGMPGFPIDGLDTGLPDANGTAAWYVAGAATADAQDTTLYGLDTAVAYAVTVRAVSVGGNGTWSAVWQVNAGWAVGSLEPEDPMAMRPPMPMLEDVGATYVTLSWPSMMDAVVYEVYLQADPMYTTGDSNATVAYYGPATYITLSNLTANAYYIVWYREWSNATNAWGAYSYESSFTTVDYTSPEPESEMDQQPCYNEGDVYDSGSFGTNYYGVYANGATCRWKLHASMPGYCAAVSFSSFATEQNFDTFRVYLGGNESAPIAFEASGALVLPYDAVFDSNEVLLVFSSDSSVGSSGVQGNVYTMPCNMSYVPPVYTNVTTPDMPEPSWTPVPTPAAYCGDACAGMPACPPCNATYALCGQWCNSTDADCMPCAGPPVWPPYPCSPYFCDLGNETGAAYGGACYACPALCVDESRCYRPSNDSMSYPYSVEEVWMMGESVFFTNGSMSWQPPTPMPMPYPNGTYPSPEPYPMPSPEMPNGTYPVEKNTCFGSALLNGTSGAFGSNRNASDATYSNGLMCSWTLEGEPTTMCYRVTFTHFLTEHNYDYLTVSDPYNGNYQTLTGAVGNVSLWLHPMTTLTFYSDSSVTSTGVQATYEMHQMLCPDVSPMPTPDVYPSTEPMPEPEVGPGCPNEGATMLYMPSDVVHVRSSEYVASNTSEYDNNQNCAWEVSVDTAMSAGECLELSFGTFELETGFDFLIVEDSMGMVLGSFTGNVTGAVYQTAMTWAKLRFVSDASVRWAGFDVAVRLNAACANTMPAPTQTPVPSAGPENGTYPYYPTPFPSPYPYPSPGDNGTYTPTPMPSPSATPWYTPTPTPGADSGYCMGMVTVDTASGELRSNPQYSQYLSDQYCEWLIAPAALDDNQCVQLSFNSFYTEEGYDFVQLFSGENAMPGTVDLLGDGNVLSGSVAPMRVFTSLPGQPLDVLFYTDGSGEYDGFSAVYEMVMCGDNGGNDNGGGGGGDGPAPSPTPIPADEVRVIGSDARFWENADAHNTSMYRVNPSSSVVLRRGRNFNFDVYLNGGGQDIFSVALTVYSSNEASVYFDSTFFDEEMDMYTVDITAWNDTSLSIVVETGVNAVLGAQRMSVTVGDQVFMLPQTIVYVEDPFNPLSGYYLGGNATAYDAYMFNEFGALYYGSARSVRSRPWSFEQFDAAVLMCACQLIETLDVYDRSDPVEVVRHLSSRINSEDNNGLLKARYRGPYTDGANPSTWTGTAAIAQEYLTNGYQPVKYANSAVFAGALASMVRALGMPARTVTNFESALEQKPYDGAIQLYYDYDGRVGYRKNSKLSKDRIWSTHQWVDVMVFGSWYSIDGTPRVISDGKYQLGPAAVSSTRAGFTDELYDVRVFHTAVAAPVEYMVKGPDDTDYVLEHVAHNEVGNVTSEFYGAMIDITAEYKGTPEEQLEEEARRRRSAPRAVTRRAVRAVRAEGGDDGKAPAMIDWDVAIQAPSHVDVGTAFQIPVRFTLDKTSVRMVDLLVTATARVVTSTSEPIADIKRVQFKVSLSRDRPVFEHRIAFIPSNYEHLLSHGTQYVELELNTAEEEWPLDRFPEVEHERVLLAVPELRITLDKEEYSVGEEISATLEWTNPIAVPLTGMRFQAAVSSNTRLPALNLDRTVGAHEAVRLPAVVKAATPGTHNVVITMSAREMDAVYGTTALVIKEKSKPTPVVAPKKDDSGAKNNAAAIAGGVVGAVCAVAVVGAFLMRRRRNALQTTSSSSGDVEGGESYIQM